MATDRFGRWASLLFGALLVVDLFFVLTAIGVVDEPPGVRLLAISGVILGAIALYAAIVALARGRPWANAVAVVILGLLAVAGVIDFVANIQTRITIPIAAIAAVIVLLQPRPADRPPAASLRATTPAVIVAAFAIATFWSPIVTAALQPGASPFAVAPTALAIEVKVDCGTTAADGRVVAAINWAWRERDILPGSTDGLFVRWAPTSDDPDASYDQGASTASDGVWSGSGSPAAALTQPLERSGVYGANTTFGIDVAGHGLADGFVRLVLNAEGAGSHGSLQVAAAYAHLDRWLRWSDEVTCRW